MTLIPPYDHPHVMAGQGTAVKKLIEETGPLDMLFMCLGGGGLLSGSVLSAAAWSPQCQVTGVEQEAGNDGQQSLARGQRVRIDVPKTIADSAATQQLGVYTFEVIQRLVPCSEKGSPRLAFFVANRPPCCWRARSDRDIHSRSRCMRNTRRAVSTAHDTRAANPSLHVCVRGSRARR